jgi:tetratricopeptide (TPR) repeat protein
MLFWEWHGHLSEGRRWLEEVLEKEGRVSAAVRAKALFAVCQMAHLQFDTDRAEAAALEGIELCAEAQMDGSLAAAFRWKLGYAARLRGDYERAQELVEESLAFSREADDKIGMADALLELGAISFLLGDPERAKEHSEEGIALCRELGYGLQLANHLGNLGYQMLLEGDYE